jgi:hypothetical protein
MVHIRLPLRRLWRLLLPLILLLPAGLSLPPAHAQPSPPDLYLPVDGTTTTAASYAPTGTPTLEWHAVSGADLYTVQICPSAGCANPLWTQETASTRYVYPHALADGIWFWRVRVHIGNEWSDYSSSWSFTKSWLDYGSLRPQLTAPAADATVEFFEYPIFSWQPVSGASYYKFQIYTQAGCSGNPSYSRSTVKPTHTPPTRLARGEYYWMVTPVDHQEHPGSSSECRHFSMDYTQKPTLLSPTDQSSQLFTPEFRWTAVKGAKDYHIQVATDPTFNNRVIDTVTNNTRYTSSFTLQNDKEFYWRVRARDTANIYGPWSPSDTGYKFYMVWHLVPTQLTPTYNFLAAPTPVFSWTPVAAAKKYTLQMADNDSFSNPIINESNIMDPHYVHTGALAFTPDKDYFWRVRARDSHEYVSLWSQTGLFHFHTPPAPTLIYPPYYYDPATISATQYLGVRTDPTVAVPVFMWDRVVDSSETSADSYRIEVYDYPTRTNLLWYTTTQNLSIAPTLENGFTLTNGVYNWHVHSYHGGAPFGEFSEWWVVRFNTLSQTYTPTIAPYFPADGMDSVYDTPLFGWSPVQGAARYDFQISTAEDFSANVHEAHPLYSFYTPQQRLAPETYYWRVKALDSGGGDIGTWSATQRVVITYPLRRGNASYCDLSNPILYDSYNPLIGHDDPGDAYGGSDYDLTDLYLARDDDPSNNYWFLTIVAPYTNNTDMYFGFYVDLDHIAYSGGTSDPRGNSIQTSPIYRPERVFYAHQNTSGQIDQVLLWRWEGSSWSVSECLGPAAPCIGGGWSFDPADYLELKIPINVLDTGETWLGTVSVEAFTVQSGSGNQANDTVPSEVNAPTGYLTNFTAAADKINPLYPWDNPFSNPFIHETNPMLSFSKPLFRSYIQGYQIQVARDIGFTNPNPPWSAEWFASVPPLYWFLPTRWARQGGFEENNTLYWRIRVRHGSGLYSAWSQPVRFTRQIYVPESMTADYTYATPSFHWQRVEGAAAYHIQVDDDSGFGSPVADATQENPSYTPSGSLADKTWFWRLRVKDGSDTGNYSDWVYGASFTKVSQTPELITPTDGFTTNVLPTFRWADILYPEQNPVVNAPRYYLCLDDDPNFPLPCYWGYTLDTNSWTPDLTLAKLDDGFWYWRVAALDASGDTGAFSPARSFYKAYLRPVPISSSFDPVPDLRWAPINGAAYYQIQICRDEAWSDCVETGVNTDQTRYVSTRPTSNYSPGVYYWRVRMCDQQNACGPYYEDQIAPHGLIYMPLLLKHKSTQ